MPKDPHAVSLGSRKSERKTAAARLNGRKGGRPSLAAEVTRLQAAVIVLRQKLQDARAYLPDASIRTEVDAALEVTRPGRNGGPGDGPGNGPGDGPQKLSESRNWKNIEPGGNSGDSEEYHD